VNKNPCLKINLLPEVLKYRLIKKLVAMKESKAGMLMEPHGILLPLQSFQKKKEKTEKKEKKESLLSQSLTKKTRVLTRIFHQKCVAKILDRFIVFFI
jgi:hypothetical protein